MENCTVCQWDIVDVWSFGEVLCALNIMVPFLLWVCAYLDIHLRHQGTVLGAPNPRRRAQGQASPCIFLRDVENCTVCQWDIVDVWSFGKVLCALNIMFPFLLWVCSYLDINLRHQGTVVGVPNPRRRAQGQASPCIFLRDVKNCTVCQRDIVDVWSFGEVLCALNIMVPFLLWVCAYLDN